MDQLSRIEIFIAVAQEQSFARAARRLGITVSAVSKQVQNLEYELQVKLFNRTTRNVAMTEEGALFFRRVVPALQDVYDAKEEINELKSLPRGNLKISAPSALGVRFLKGPIAEFAKTYPQVHLDLHFDDRVVDLAQEGFDVAIRIGALPDSGMVARKLAPCPLYVVASPEYWAEHGTPLTPQDLASHNVLAYTRNQGAHEWRYREPDGRVRVVPLRGTFRCDFAEVMIEAACHGIGVMISPLFFIHKHLEDGRLVPVLQAYKSAPERGLYAVFPPNRYHATRLRLFVDHIARSCLTACGEYEDFVA